MNKYESLYFALSNSQIVNSNGETLSQDELLMLWNFINLLIGSRYSTFIFRGESNENLIKQYNWDTNVPDLLAQCIFMTGEKGRMCWNQKKILDPENTSSDNFQSICKMINNCIERGCTKGNVNRRQKILDFVQRNQRFCDAFKNIEQLVHTYNKLTEDDRKIVNLYYLSILHTINSYKYQEASNFVSTTTDHRVAKQFTDDATIYGWVPKATFSGIVQNQPKTIEYFINKNTSAIKKLCLPFCNTPVYPDQKEILLRCGILPHFIIGFKTSKRFYVNPAIYSSMSKMNEINSFRKLCSFKKKLILWGLDVDQSNFEEFCYQTNFKRFYTYDGYKYELHSLY